MQQNITLLLSVFSDGRRIEREHKPMEFFLLVLGMSEASQRFFATSVTKNSFTTLFFCQKTYVFSLNSLNCAA